MYKILLGFNETKLQKALGKAFDAYGDDVEFITANKKAIIPKEIRSEKPHVVILSEQCADGVWSVDEIAQIADGYSGQIVPLLSFDMYGNESLKVLCTYGVTDALFLDRNGKFNSGDVVRIVHQPRTMRDARSYYGIQSMQDIEGYSADSVDGYTYEYILSKLENESNSTAEIGAIFKKEILELSPAAVADFIQKLPQSTKDKLMRTSEWYEVMELLKKAGIIKRYKVPKEIRKQMREQEKIVARFNQDGKERSEEVTGFSVFGKEKTEPDDGMDELDEEDEKEEEAYTEDDFDDFLEPETSLFSSNEQEGSETKSDTKSGMQETDAEFVSGVEVEEEAQFGFFGHPEPAEYDPVKGQKGTAEKKKAVSLADTEKKHLSEYAETEPPKKYGTVVVIVVVIVCLAVFIIILAVMFVNITAKRRQATDGVVVSGYDTQYGGENERIELTGTGSAVLVDEREEELALEIATQEEPMQPDIEVPTNENGSTQEESAVDLLYTGTKIRGVDLVNSLNSPSGFDCIIRTKSGAEVEVKQGFASLEDINATAYYLEATGNGQTYYVQE